MTAFRGSHLSAIDPLAAVEGGRLWIRGEDLFPDADHPPVAVIGSERAPVVFASPDTIVIEVPPDAEGGRREIQVPGASGETLFATIGRPVATGIHQVDNPVFDAAGNLYVTYSGGRGQRAPVSIFRIGRDGSREPFVMSLPNPTSLAFDAHGDLFVTARFESRVYRVRPDGTSETYATQLGVPTGLAFAPDGTLFVGDRSGTILRLGPGGRAWSFATLPSSVAAFHLAFGPDLALYVTAPTFAPNDPVFRIDAQGKSEVYCDGFGRPQGIAFDAEGSLYVTDAAAGDSAVYRVKADGSRERIVSGRGLIGLALDPFGGLVVSSNDVAYRIELPLRPL